MIRVAIFIVALLASSLIVASESESADALTKAALYIFDGDFINESPEKTFTLAELELLATQTENLSQMIDQALGRGNSATAADLIGYFKLYGSVPVLRFRLLKPGSPYGWEGTGPGEEALLADNQYVYHHRYFDALYALFGDDVAQNLQLSQTEKDRIIQISESETGQQRYWAKWMRRKLGF